MLCWKAVTFTSARPSCLSFPDLGPTKDIIMCYYICRSRRQVLGTIPTVKRLISFGLRLWISCGHAVDNLCITLWITRRRSYLVHRPVWFCRHFALAFRSGSLNSQTPPMYYLSMLCFLATFCLPPALIVIAAAFLPMSLRHVHTPSGASHTVHPLLSRDSTNQTRSDPASPPAPPL